MATVQEGYFADFQVYTNGTASNSGGTTASLSGFVPSAGVTVVAVNTGGTGWSATAAHSATTRTCGIFVGGVAAPSGVTVEAEPKCN
jgi:hypothetical protein